MERLWSHAAATGGNWRQVGRASKRLKQVEIVAGCDRLPPKCHGKEKVD
jgi:hypothetical protein